MLSYSRRWPAMSALFSSRCTLRDPRHAPKRGHVSHKTRSRRRYTRKARIDRLKQRDNYKLFNRDNLNIRCWSWTYRGYWHQTCPPIDNSRMFYILPIPTAILQLQFALLHLVTTSPNEEWANSAPAATRRCGSSLSGSLSGVEP